MAWRPLVVADRRAALVAVIRDIVAAVDEIAATTVDQHVDRAILHAYVAREEVAPDPDDRCGTALASAVTELMRSPTAPGLLGGAAGLGWCVAQLAEDETAELVCRRIDQMLLRLLADWRGPYDLVSGLVGFGVYALARGEPGHALAVRVREQLPRRARSLGDGLAWHTPPGELTPRQHSDAPDGVWNLGLAHGVPGVIALLARYLTAGVDVERARELLDGATSGT
jgi:lantibiotic biosynthesis protein